MDLLNSSLIQICAGGKEGRQRPFGENSNDISWLVLNRDYTLGLDKGPENGTKWICIIGQSYSKLYQCWFMIFKSCIPFPSRIASLRSLSYLKWKVELEKQDWSNLYICHQTQQKRESSEWQKARKCNGITVPWEQAWSMVLVFPYLVEFFFNLVEKSLHLQNTSVLNKSLNGTLDSLYRPGLPKFAIYKRL